MILDPNQLESVPTSAILNEVVQGRLDIDHRVLRSLLGRPSETISSLLEVVATESWVDSGDLEIDLAQLFHALQAPEGVPFLVEAVRRRPDEIRDEVAEALHFFGQQAIDPLLTLYAELEEEDADE